MLRLAYFVDEVEPMIEEGLGLSDYNESWATWDVRLLVMRAREIAQGSDSVEKICVEFSLLLTT